MKKIALHWQIFAALLAAALFGIFLPDMAAYVKWMGDIFLRLLKMIVVPLVFATIVSGVAGMGNGDNLGRLGLKTIGFYLMTTLMAILTGLILVNLFAPGSGANLVNTATEGLGLQSKSLGELLMGIIPSNLFQAFSEPNMLGIILFSMLMGIFIPRLPEKQSVVLKDFFDSFSALILRITVFIIRFTPLGIFGIVSGVVAEQAGNMQNLALLGSRLGIYMGIVAFAILFHGLITLSLVLRASGIRPLKHLKDMSGVLLMAFSTSSSNATLPLTMKDVTTKSGVDEKLVSFTLPLGATVNMNGTALYECVAVMFIAQAYGIQLTWMQQGIVVLTALLAAVGSAGIPMAGIVMMSIIMTAVGLPLEGIGLILAVDRPLDMMRTALNVYGDTCAAVVVAKSEGGLRSG